MLVARGEVQVSVHGYEELAADGVHVRDIVPGLAAAVLVEDYPDYAKVHASWFWSGIERINQSCSLGYTCPVEVLQRLSSPRTGTFSVIVERDPDTGLLVGSVPGWPGAHSQGATLDELDTNLREVIEMLLQDGDPKLESEFVGLQTIQVA